MNDYVRKTFPAEQYVHLCCWFVCLSACVCDWLSVCLSVCLCYYMSVDTGRQ